MRDLLDSHRETPFFNLLYVGEDADRAAALTAAPVEKSLIRKTGALTPAKYAEELTLFGTKQAWYVGPRAGCLVVVYDGGETTTAIEEIRRCHEPGETCPQIAYLLVTERDAPIPFETLLRGIENNVLAVGDWSSCLEALGSWCRDSADPADWPHLGAPFAKAPGIWLRDIYHDYFSNGVRRLPREGGPFWEGQREIDFWQNALRGILVDPYGKAGSLALLPAEENETYELIHDHRRSCPLLVPKGLDELLLAQGFRASRLRVYEDPGRAGALSEACDRAILVRRADDDAHWDGPALPTVLVGRESPRLGWRDWRDFLAAGGIGAFSQARFAEIAKVKLGAWRPFAYKTPREAVDMVLSRLIETHRSLTAAGNTAMASTAFRCLAAVWCARGLYFGRDTTFKYNETPT